MTETPGTTPPFFSVDGDRFVPALHARSPWSVDMMHGRLLAGLAARATEQAHGAPDFTPARLTVDLFRPPPMQPLRVATSVVRDGRRIRVVDAEVATGDTVLARTSTVMLKQGSQPDNPVWAAPEWSVPGPDELAPPTRPEGQSPFPMDLRSPEGHGFGTGASQKQVWLRDTSPLVAGEDPSPFVRVAVAADLASPLSNSGRDGLDFINADYSVYLRRLPRSEWIGLEVTGHLSEAGVAVGQCQLYDLDGAIGYSVVAAVVNVRMDGSS